MASTSSSSEATWQRIWDNSQERLSTIRESLAQGSTPKPRVTRVGKLDAELLDQELVQVLQDPLAKAIALVNSTFKGQFEPELALCIQLTLYKFSLWDTGATYGAKLQGLRYTTVPHSGGSPSFRLPRRLLLIHGAITMLVPYIHTRLRAHALSQAWPDAPSSDKRRKAWEFLTRLESLHSTFTLLNFVAFLWNGSYRTLADRLLRMRLVSTQRVTSRDVSYEFMNRQMVWHAFTEFLLFLLPLVNTRAIARRLSQLSQVSLTSALPRSLQAACGLSTNGETKSRSNSRRGKYWSLPLDQCAICYQDSTTNLSDPAAALSSLATQSYVPSSAPPADATEGSEEEPPPFPIHTPYVTDCGHIYCYVCITGRLMRTADDASGVGPGGRRWECLRCGEAVASAERMQMEDVESEYGSEDAASFEFGSEELDFSTDMSGSVVDDTESFSSD